MAWRDPQVRLAAEIERLVNGYRYAIEVIREVAAEGTGEAAEQLRPCIVEVFELYREPLEELWGHLGAVKQKQVRGLDDKLLKADDDVKQLLGMSLSERLDRIGRAEQT